MEGPQRGIVAAAVSAAFSQADSQSLDPCHSQNTAQIAVGTSPSLKELQAWKSGFERTMVRTGYRLAGFRQQSDGLLIAIIARSN